MFDPAEPLSSDFVKAVKKTTTAFLRQERDLLADTGAQFQVVWDQASHFLAGGKRLRPAFCYWAYVAAAGDPGEDTANLLSVAASLDFTHVAALVHDDVIDASDTRRGGPSAHRFFAQLHESEGWTGDATHFGTGAAIVLGDLLLAWAGAMVDQSGWPQERLKRARPYLNAMRSEVMAGQFLDLIHEVAPVSPEDMVKGATLVMEFKTSRYTVSRPSQIGAALGGASDVTLEGLGRFGAHVGHAFQMRDDVLGVFGDPQVTGKPAGDDLREGKKTVLVGYGLKHATPEDRDRLIAMLGDQGLTDTDVEEGKRILQESGALKKTEKAIVSEAIAGSRVISRLDLTTEGMVALSNLVHAAVERTK